jgi:iron complex outermembrane recepter protein
MLAFEHKGEQRVAFKNELRIGEVQMSTSAIDRWSSSAAGLVSAVAVGVIAALPASAQENAALEEIVVTAQKRSEPIQDVPIAISALGSEDLAKRGVVDIAELRGSVPGLTISYSTGLNASNLVALRGVSGLPLPIGTSQATAIYLDGVYMSRPNGAFFALDDVERIEVLRGPQGTLYGRNATAGAINIITRIPGEDLRGGFDLSYGNFNTVNSRGSLSGPLGGGFAGGISAGYDRHDGYFKNTVTGNDVGDRESYTVRGSLRFASDDDAFSAVLAGDYGNIDYQGTFRNGYASLAPTAPYIGITNPHAIFVDAPSEALTESYTKLRGVALTLNYALSDAVDLTSISSYRMIDNFDAYDLDGTVAPLFFTIATNDSDTFNQELRAVLTWDRLHVTAGANYFNEKATYRLKPLGGPSAVYSLISPRDTSDLKAYAAFTQVEYDVLPALTLVGGLRFNREERDFTTDYSQLPPPGNQKVNGRIEDDVTIPSAGVNWKVTEDALLYAKYSQGYQAPGFNAQPDPLVTTANTFGAESLDAYEVGIKSEFLGRRVVLNAAGFWYEYSDLQVRYTPRVGVTAVNNAASATIKGLEVSLVARVIDALTLTVQTTYSDGTYGSFCETVAGGSPLNGDPTCADPLFADRSGNRLNLAPEWSGGISVDYALAVGTAGQLNFNAGYSFETKSYFTPANEEVVSTGGWDRVDSRIGFELNNGLEIYLYGKNLTDERYPGFALRANPTFMPVVISDPRTYGGGVRYHF